MYNTVLVATVAQEVCDCTWSFLFEPASASSMSSLDGVPVGHLRLRGSVARDPTWQQAPEPEPVHEAWEQVKWRARNDLQNWILQGMEQTQRSHEDPEQQRPCCLVNTWVLRRELGQEAPEPGNDAWEQSFWSARKFMLNWLLQGMESSPRHCCVLNSMLRKEPPQEPGEELGQEPDQEPPQELAQASAPATKKQRT